MRIAIVGAGALGCLFGGFLANSGQDVLLMDHNPEKVRLINLNGLLIEEPAGTITAAVHAASSANGLPPADLVIILVKTTSTDRALAGCAPLIGADTILMTLQNGYGNAEDLMAAADPDRIIVGTTSQGSALLGPGHIRHSGCGETHIGACAGLPASRLAEVAGLFNAAGITTTVARSEEHTSELQ